MELSPSDMQKLAEYDHETGLLIWRARDGAEVWNAKYAGRPALNSNDGRGYRQGLFLGRKLYAHRAIWAVVYGCWPDGEIDHIDGNRSNNRIDNLRVATRAENNRNTSSRKLSSSKFLGVSWDRAGSKWRADIKIGGKAKYLGRFESEAEAARAYAEAAAIHYGQFAGTFRQDTTATGANTFR